MWELPVAIIKAYWLDLRDWIVKRWKEATGKDSSL